MPPEVTAADREVAETIVRDHMWMVIDVADYTTLVNVIATALATVRADGEIAGAANRDVIMDQAEHIARERDDLQVRVATLEAAWSQSWDCSADPGHRIMNAAFDALAPGAGGTHATHP